MIAFRIDDPRQIADAIVVGSQVVGEMARSSDFTFGPLDDAELRSKLTVWVDGPDEVEAAEVLGARLIAAGIPFDGVPA